MERLSNGRREWETQLRTMRRSLAAIDDALPPEMTPEEEEAARNQQQEAATACKGRKSAFTVSLILFILAAISGCAAFFLRTIDTYLSIGAVGFAGIAAVCGIAAFVRSLSQLEKYHAILQEWGVSDTDALGDVIEERIHLSRQRISSDSEYSILETEIGEKEAGLKEDTQTLRTCAALFTEEAPDTDIMTEGAMAAAKKLLDQQVRLQEEYHTAAGRLCRCAGSCNTGSNYRRSHRGSVYKGRTNCRRIYAGRSRKGPRKCGLLPQLCRGTANPPHGNGKKAQRYAGGIRPPCRAC